MPQTLIPYRPRKRTYAAAMLGLGARAYRAYEKKYGPIDYRKAASTIQKAYRSYKKRKVVRRKSVIKRSTKAFPRARIGTLMGVHGRKGPNPKRLKGVRAKFDKSLISEQNMTNYIGFGLFGSADDILRTYCMHLAKDMMIRSGAPIDSWQGEMKVHAGSGSFQGRLDSVHLRFTKDTFDTSYDDVEDIVLAAGVTGNDFVGLLHAAIRSWYFKGYYPQSYSLVENDGTPNGRRFYSNETWGEDMVYFTGSTLVKLQNITPADEGGTNINDVNANPLTGRVYDFKHPYVKLRDEYAREVEAIAGFGDLAKLQNINASTDLVDVNKLRSTLTSDLAQAFVKLPRGVAVFSNLDGAKGMSMPPGGYQVVKRLVKCAANTKRFIAGIYNNITADNTAPYLKPISRPIVNKVMLIGFEPTVRSATNETTKVICNRKITHDIIIRRKKPSNVPVFNEVQDIVSI